MNKSSSLISKQVTKKNVVKKLKKDLSQKTTLSSKLDRILEFQDQQEESTVGKWGRRALVTGALGVAGWQGIKAHKFIKVTGGYKKNAALFGNAISGGWSGRPGAELSARLDDILEFGDPRPRNPLGEFTNQEEGSPDPNAMARVYNTKQLGLAAGAGAGAGAIGGPLVKSLYSKLRGKTKV